MVLNAFHSGARCNGGSSKQQRSKKKLSRKKQKRFRSLFYLTLRLPRSWLKLFVHDKPLMLNFGHFFLAPSRSPISTRRWFFVPRRGLINQALKFTSNRVFNWKINMRTSSSSDCLLPQFTPKLPRLRKTFLTDYWLKRNVIVTRRFQRPPQIMAFNVTSPGRINSPIFFLFQISTLGRRVYHWCHAISWNLNKFFNELR